MPTIKKEVEKNYREIEALREFATKFINRNYPNLDFKKEYVTINNRLKKTLGFFRVKKTKNNEYIEPKIELSGKLVKYGHEEIILGTLKHELIHYSLCFLGLPYDDGNKIFENELIKHNAPSNFRRSDIKHSIGLMYSYNCKICKKEYMTKIKKVYQEPKRYSTVCCDSKIELGGIYVSDGYNIKKFKGKIR